MNSEEIRTYCLSLPGTTEDMPYGPDMIVYRIEKKIYLHQPLEYEQARISIKLPIETGEELRAKYPNIVPAYHLNKQHWSDIPTEDVFDDTQLKEWIDISYTTVLNSLPKKIREQYKKGE